MNIIMMLSLQTIKSMHTYIPACVIEANFVIPIQKSQACYIIGCNKLVYKVVTCLLPSCNKVDTTLSYSCHKLVTWLSQACRHLGIETVNRIGQP